MNRARVLKVLAAARASRESQENSSTAANHQPAQTKPENEASSHDELNETPRQVQKSSTNRQPLRPIQEQDELEQLDRWDPMAEDYLSTKNTLLLDPEKDPECVVTGRVTDETLKVGKYKVCDFYLKYGSCADGIYCDRLHIDPKSRSKINSLQRIYESSKGRICLNYDYLSPQEYEPDKTRTLLVTVTLAKAPNNFYLVAPYEKMNFNGFNQEEIDFYIERVKLSSTFKTKLQKCHEQLAYLFNHNYRRDNVEDLIYQSQIVACKLEDGRFCRAEVIEVENVARDRFTFKLFLLDVGIEVNLPRESIYDIKVHSLTAPPMALACRLNLKPTDDDLHWSPAALDFFRNHVQDEGYMLCKVLEYNESERMYTVDLFDLDNRSSLTTKMVAGRLADRSSPLNDDLLSAMDNRDHNGYKN